MTVRDHPVNKKNYGEKSRKGLKIFMTKKITRVAVIAALYTVITLLFAPISYGSVQFRISEMLGILPLFFPEAVWGLTLGCFISNIFSPNPLDFLLGTLATLMAAGCTYFIGVKIKKHLPRLILGILPPILFNAIIVPFTFLAITELKELYFLSALQVAAGQAVVLIAGGFALYYAILKIFKKNE